MSLLTIVLSGIVFLFLVIFIIDFIPQFYTWQSRIKIGRFATASQWKQKIASKANKWLKKTPVIKLTDNDRLIIIDVIRGNYKRNAIQSWQEALLILGLNDYNSLASENEVTKSINDYINRKIKSDGTWVTEPKEIDGAILAFSIIYADPGGSSKYKPAMDQVRDLVFSLVGEDGTVAYRKYTADYRFVDTVGFISPFLMKYGILYNDPECINLSLKQIFEYNEKGFGHKPLLPCHTYKIIGGNLVGLTGWGRGLAWYILGVMDTYKVMPESMHAKQQLRILIKELFDEAVKYQDVSGGFHWILTDQLSRLDSSVTAVLAWFFKECETILDSGPVRDAKEKALNYLKSVTRRDGAVDFSQGDTKAIGVYSLHFDILPFTQGFVLRAITENTI